MPLPHQLRALESLGYEEPEVNAPVAERVVQALKKTTIKGNRIKTKIDGGR